MPTKVKLKHKEFKAPAAPSSSPLTRGGVDIIDGFAIPNSRETIRNNKENRERAFKAFADGQQVTNKRVTLAQLTAEDQRAGVTIYSGLGDEHNDVIQKTTSRYHKDQLPKDKRHLTKYRIIASQCHYIGDSEGANTELDAKQKGHFFPDAPQKALFVSGCAPNLRKKVNGAPENTTDYATFVPGTPGKFDATAYRATMETLWENFLYATNDYAMEKNKGRVEKPLSLLTPLIGGTAYLEGADLSKDDKKQARQIIMESLADVWTKKCDNYSAIGEVHLCLPDGPDNNYEEAESVLKQTPNKPLSISNTDMLHLGKKLGDTGKEIAIINPSSDYLIGGGAYKIEPKERNDGTYTAGTVNLDVKALEEQIAQFSNLLTVQDQVRNPIPLKQKNLPNQHQPAAVIPPAPPPPPPPRPALPADAVIAPLPALAPIQFPDIQDYEKIIARINDRIERASHSQNATKELKKIEADILEGERKLQTLITELNTHIGSERLKLTTRETDPYVEKLRADLREAEGELKAAQDESDAKSLQLQTKLNEQNEQRAILEDIIQQQEDAIEELNDDLDFVDAALTESVRNATHHLHNAQSAYERALEEIDHHQENNRDMIATYTRLKTELETAKSEKAKADAELQTAIDSGASEDSEDTLSLDILDKASDANSRFNNAQQQFDLIDADYIAYDKQLEVLNDAANKLYRDISVKKTVLEEAKANDAKDSKLIKEQIAKSEIVVIDSKAEIADLDDKLKPLQDAFQAAEVARQAATAKKQQAEAEITRIQNEIDNARLDIKNYEERVKKLDLTTHKDRITHLIANPTNQVAYFSDYSTVVSGPTKELFLAAATEMIRKNCNEVRTPYGAIAAHLPYPTTNPFASETSGRVNLNKIPFDHNPPAVPPKKGWFERFTDTLKSHTNSAYCFTVQQSYGNTCISKFYLDPEDIKKMDEYGVLRLAATEIENFKIALGDAFDPKAPPTIEIMVNTPPRLAEKIVLYCEAKNIPYENNATSFFYDKNDDAHKATLDATKALLETMKGKPGPFKDYKELAKAPATLQQEIVDLEGRRPGPGGGP